MNNLRRCRICIYLYLYIFQVAPTVILYRCYRLAFYLCFLKRYIYTHTHTNTHTFSIWPLGFLCGASGKEPTWQYRRYKRHGFDSWVRKIPWRRKWQPTQYPCLENPMDRRAWKATVHRVAENQT